MFNNNIMNRKNIMIDNRTLDKYQAKAVLCNKDNYLVIAGAGSGKTLTIIAKIKFLIKTGYKENEILCISFTNETVNSIKEKLVSNNINIDVLTFHKLSLRILNNKYKIAPQDLLKYTIEEFFESIVYHDNSYKLLEYINIKETKEMILSFIMYMKSLNENEVYLYKLINNRLIPIDDKIYLVLILKIYLLYKEELLSEKKIDFDDMINYAYELVNTLTYFQYKYIIIDEYQDTSLSKYKLIKALIDKFKIRLLTVGDDYQSIYSFTGCKLSLFTKYKKYFPKSKIIKLKYTYRNPNDIVQISKRFVMKNRNQIKKRLISNKYTDKSIIIIYSNDEVKSVLSIINNYNNILILGRNNINIETLINNPEFINNYQQIGVDKNINYLTIHKSKGLEEDNVIILNVIDDILGFPNKIKENRILNYIRESDDLESERRLFYVALTRARERVFILTKTNKESIFIKELIREFKYKIKIIDLDKNSLNNMSLII